MAQLVSDEIYDQDSCLQVMNPIVESWGCDPATGAGDLDLEVFRMWNYETYPDWEEYFDTIPWEEWYVITEYETFTEFEDQVMFYSLGIEDWDELRDRGRCRAGF